jgi:hypothetical protein
MGAILTEIDSELLGNGYDAPGLVRLYWAWKAGFGPLPAIIPDRSEKENLDENRDR